MGIDLSKANPKLRERISAAIADEDRRSTLNEELKKKLFSGGNKAAAYSDMRSTKRGRMNKLESEFEELLRSKLLNEEIVEYKYEPIKLYLADKRTSYTPDFQVIELDGTITLYEVKGYWLDKARVKTKTAAEYFSEYRIVGVQKERGKWTYENFN